MNDTSKQRIEQLVGKLKTKYDNVYVCELHSLIASSVRYIALKYLHNVSDAEDLVQDFWLDIRRIVNFYHNNKNAFGYLCKTAQNMAINRCKKIQSCRKHEEKYVQLSELYRDSKDEEKYDVQYTVEKAMNCLTEVQKIIIQISYFEDKTIRETAKDLKMSKSAVQREKQSALKLLKEELSKYYD